MKQGHRRLNVLFSRARDRIALFTSMSSDDIRPAATSAEGIHILKRYLEYAESQGRMHHDESGSDPQSDFEIAVAARLRQKGYSVETQVGVSGYRIDLGIRHPEIESHFIAGIECDGASYHSSKSARDRDRLRQEILTGLGWNILRVWSTDWFQNASYETDKLIREIEALRNKKPFRRASDFRFAADKQVSPDISISESPEISTEGDIVQEQQTPRQTKSSAEDLAASLRGLRDSVIAHEITDWEAHRSILRDSMIETFIAQRITDPEQWYTKIPLFQRTGTNPVEKQYLERICEIIEEALTVV
jgi:very-short-patch-repair endonuclease